MIIALRLGGKKMFWPRGEPHIFWKGIPRHVRKGTRFSASVCYIRSTEGCAPHPLPSLPSPSSSFFDIEEPHPRFLNTAGNFSTQSAFFYFRKRAAFYFLSSMYTVRTHRTCPSNDTPGSVKVFNPRIIFIIAVSIYALCKKWK